MSRGRALANVAPPSRRDHAVETSSLSHKLAWQILEHVRHCGLAPGDRLTEFGLANALEVSRTPIRAALDQLAGAKLVTLAGPRQGYHLTASAEQVEALLNQATGSDEEEELYVAIAQDYLAERLQDQFTEADLMRIYTIGRSLLSRVLQRMAGERVIERKPGYGWRFVPLLRSVESHDDSYRFRIAVEPAAFLQPGFTLDFAWATRTRAAHEAVLATAPKRVSMVRFFAMNADFHELMASASRNPFLLQAVQQQNQIRRFQNYAWVYGTERIASCCHEHLEILTAAESGDRDWAATLMRRHLELACRLKP